MTCTSFGENNFQTVAGIAATRTDGLQIRKVTTRTTDNFQVPCLSNGVAGKFFILLLQFDFKIITIQATYSLRLSSRSTANLCDTLDRGIMCSLLPSDVACSCPLEARTYYNPNAYVTFDAEWLGLDGGVDVSNELFAIKLILLKMNIHFLIQGDYTTHTELVANLGAPNELIVGCIEIDYTLNAVA